MQIARPFFKAFFFCLFSLFYTTAFLPAQTPKKTKLNNPVTPNGIPLNQGINIDKTEIANIHYAEFLDDIQKDSSVMYLYTQVPNLELWAQTYEIGDTLVRDPIQTLLYPKFRFFPVVGVSYEQAVEYCKWRSRVVNRVWNLEKMNKEAEKYIFEVKYRLPEPGEWDQAAGGGLDSLEHPWGIERPHKKNRVKIDKNYQQLLDCLKDYEGKAASLYEMEFRLQEKYYQSDENAPFSCHLEERNYPRYILEGPPNGLGIYNMYGNVAEMTSVSGLAKGGSYLNSFGELSPRKNFSYQGPQNWLGFRCIVEVQVSPRN